MSASTTSAKGRFRIRRTKGLATVEPDAVRRTLRMLRPHLKGQRALAMGGLAATLLEVAMRLLEPWPVKWVIDAIIPAAVPGAAVQANILELLIAAAVVTLAIAGVRALAAYLGTIAFNLVGSRVTSTLREHVFDHILSLSVGFHDRTRTGDLLVRISGDIQRLQEVAVTAGLPLVANGLTFVGMTAVMLWLDPLLTVVVLAVMPIFAFTGSRASRKITSAARKQRVNEGALAGVAGEAFSAIRVVHAYGLEERLTRLFSAGNQKSLKTGITSRRLAAGLERRTDLLIGIATAVVLLMGAQAVLSHKLTPGELVVFLTYLKSAFKPMRDMAKQTGRISRAAASGERIADLLEVKPDIVDRSYAKPLERVRGHVHVDGIVVEYEPGHRVLDNASLHVLPGDRVAIIGPSGIGKSTLLSVLLRMIEPKSGTVRIDGHELADVTIASLRANTAVVLQDSVLFATSIEENIRWSRPGATDQEVRAAARAAGADTFIDQQPQGYATVVGERGATLSGGQRQRVAIARAILRDAALVLLDEPTTGLDSRAKQEVLAGLQALTSQRTTIVVTHDPELVAACNRVVEVVDGRLVERTTRGDRWRRTGTPQDTTADPRSDAARHVGIPA